MESSLVWAVLMIVGLVAVGCLFAIAVAVGYLINHWRRYRAGF
ncbi:hypothetical protein [Kitasatospora atroaurantiaca]|uniref:Uncharacterized protein n=1 Tax=Kitasatospora atroaurantiaca TaxID=285545 RepID=A0A561ERK4_9ACTN|nr:hypothetical protein [Kitasatospora atroaurantiaca]TWE18237.1 hypothetical protein FB465_3290 [Kitasatospora atroaurantiaca]